MEGARSEAAESSGDGRLVNRTPSRRWGSKRMHMHMPSTGFSVRQLQDLLARPGKEDSAIPATDHLTFLWVFRDGGSALVEVRH